MTITSTTNRVTYSCDGVAVTFPYTFYILLKSDLQVYDIDASGNPTLKTLITDYDVSGAGSPTGGNVVMNAAPTAGHTLLIVRVEPFTQASSLPSNDKFPTTTVEAALDKLTMIVQQLNEVDQRSIKLALTSLYSNLTVPDPVAGLVLRWKNDLSGLENANVTGQGAITLPVPIVNGGTGTTTAAAAIQALLAGLLTTKGDLVVATGAAAQTRVPVGADGTVVVARAGASAGVEYAKQSISQIFHGLHLRTNPDNSLRKSQVAMLALKSACMSDGTRYDDIVVPGTDAPLIADITASGAAGLDTGTEAASVWYSVRLVGKSSTKAKSDLRLVLHREKDYLKDQFFEPADDVSRLLRIATGTATDLLAQGFQTANTGKVEFADVKLTFNNSPTGNMWLEIRSDNAGSPSTTVLATSDKLDVAPFVAGGAANTLRFVFRTPATLNSATQYHLVLNADYTRSDTVAIGWRGLVAGGYANGAAKEFNGTTWANASGVGDFYFRVFVTRNDNAITFPAGYDQECKLGFVYNSSGSDFVPFSAHDRKVRYMANNKVFPSAVSSVPSINVVSAFIPPVPVLATFDVLNNTANLGNTGIAGTPEGYQMISGAGTAGGATLVTAQPASTQFQLQPAFLELQSLYIITSGATNFDVYLGSFEW